MLKILAVLLGALKFSKFIGTGGTMLLSVLLYSFIFGWPYAVGFVMLMFVHEMGHFIAARRRGLEVGMPTFIPFIGAWVELKTLPHNAETEAYVGLGGPLLGTAGALLCWLFANEYDSQLLLALAYSGCFLNLFNLIPISPFDGGRITAILSPRIWLLGVPILIGLFIWHPSPLLILMALMAAPKVIEAWQGITTKEQEKYYDILLTTRINYAIIYLSMVVFLALVTQSLYEQLPNGK